MKNYSEAFLLSLITANIPRIIAANIIPHCDKVGIITNGPSPPGGKGAIAKRLGVSPCGLPTPKSLNIVLLPVTVSTTNIAPCWFVPAEPSETHMLPELFSAIPSGASPNGP